MLHNMFYILVFLSILLPKQLSILDVQKISSKFIDYSSALNNYYTIASIDDLMIENTPSNMYLVRLNPVGFIIISKDDRSFPILGYSYNNAIDMQNLPKQLEVILNSYEKGIDYIIDNNIIQDRRTSEFLNFNYEENPFLNRNTREVLPLITANWNQGGGWNVFCPGNSVVGCVAVAMGQVMNYWQYPTQGYGYSQYYDPEYGVIAVNFEEHIYNFDNMYDDYPTEDSQLLLFHSGVAVHMNYSPWGSGASVCWEGPSAQNALDESFGYNDDITCEVKINYTDENWNLLIQNQLDRGWPMIYRGYSDDAGHAWNIDGYQNEFYHCNWGWGGSSNGYFYFDNLNAGGYNFIESQAALLNIVPEIFNNPIALFDFDRTDLLIEFYDLSQITSEDEIIFWEWDFGDGNRSLDSNPIHTYEEYGSYNVSLVVMSEYGLYSELHIEVLDVLNLVGDFNQDSSVDILDVVILVDFILLNKNLNLDLYDINIDLQIDVLDIISLIQIIIN